jgi:hypothetical protein
MPQAVQAFVDTRDFRKVDIEKRHILTLYVEDIDKHGGKNATKIRQVYDLIPAQLSNNNKRFMFSAISDTARYREYEEALLWLKDARIVNLCFNTTEPTVGPIINSTITPNLRNVWKLIFSSRNPTSLPARTSSL